MNGGTGDKDPTGSSRVTCMSSPDSTGRKQSGWGRERGPDSHNSHSKSQRQLGHGCPLPAAPIPGTATGNLQSTAWPYPPTLPGPLAMAQLESADHHESNLPGSVEPLLASVSLPSSDLLYKQGISPHQLRAGTPPHHEQHHPTVPWVLQLSKGPSMPRALGAIALAGTCLAAQPWPCSSPV